MFAALASNPALLQQLSLAVMLAPAVYMRHVASLPMVALASLDVDKVSAYAIMVNYGFDGQTRCEYAGSGRGRRHDQAM